MWETGGSHACILPFMVVKVTRKRVCDICENEDGVNRYRITKLEEATQRTVTSDLCVEHAEGLEQAIKVSPMPRRGRKTARPVVSLDEIPKKRASKKAPAKKTGARKRS